MTIDEETGHVLVALADGGNVTVESFRPSKLVTIVFNRTEEERVPRDAMWTRFTADEQEELRDLPRDSLIPERFFTRLRQHLGVGPRGGFSGQSDGLYIADAEFWDWLEGKRRPNSG